MACYITYGAISLEGVLIKSIKCDQVQGEDGITDRYKKYTIMFAAHCNGANNVNQLLRDGAGVRSMFTAETLLQYLSQPRQYFRLEYNDVSLIGPSGKPGLGQTIDSGGGPRTYGMQVTNVAGELGYSSPGGYFLVSGTFEVCVENSPDLPLGQYIQGYSMGCDHDADGDTMLTTITTSIVVYGRPEAIRSIEAGGTQSVWIGFKDLRLILETVPAGFKRRRAKIQVNPGGMEARIVFIDSQMHLPLGSESAASVFEPSQTEVSRIDEKGAGAGAMTIITVNAICPKNDVRERVIKQMFWWVVVKGQGTVPGVFGQSANFVGYREVVLSIEYATNKLQLTVKIKKNLNLNGVAGIPFNISASGLTAGQDYSKVDQWGAPSRQAEEPAQGTQRNLALSPTMNYYGTAGSYVAEILVDRIRIGLAESSRLLPDGSSQFCLSGSASLNQPNENKAYYTGPDEGENVQVDIVDQFNLPDISLGWTTISGQTYESTWMQTKYDTAKGTMVLPTGGVMPGGVTPPENIRKRVQATVHQGMTTKTVHWGVQSVSESCPPYPSSAPPDENQILVKEKIQPAACNPVGPGMFAWTITGTYTYELLNLKGSGDTLGIGLLPISPGNVADYNIGGGCALPGYIPP